MVLFSFVTVLIFTVHYVSVSVLMDWSKKAIIQNEHLLITILPLMVQNIGILVELGQANSLR